MPTPASAQLAAQPFTAYGQGDAIALNALTLGNTQVAGLRVAASGGSVNSSGAGLSAPIVNEFNQNVQPSAPDKNAYGRGAAVEAGLITGTPQPVDINQIIASGLAQAFAPPPSPPVVATTDIPLVPILYASTARGEAQATYDPVYCPVGRPISFGRGYVENLELLGSGQDPDGSIASPLLGTSTNAGNPRATTSSRTVTYVTGNGDGTFGLVAETRQTVAPISVGAIGGLTGILIEVAGEIGFRAIATGKPAVAGNPNTGARVEWTGDPLITISANVAGVQTPLAPPLTLQQIVGQGGLGTPAALAGLLSLSLGQPPRGLKQPIGSTPTIAPDGTSASGAVDLLRLTVGGTLLDLGVSHMEAAVAVPAGGLKCQIPVSKTASSDPVTVGQDFTYTIRIPSDVYQALFNCNLLNISAVDTVETQSGSPRIVLLSASNGGVISGNKVTWANLGNYTLGQEPITLTIQARIPPNSGAGVLRDRVDVSATLGNCGGGTGLGTDIITGNANLNGNAITGSVTLVGPNVNRGNLAATGGNSWPLVAGGGFLLAALGLVRLRRRASEVPAQS